MPNPLIDKMGGTGMVNRNAMPDQQSQLVELYKALRGRDPKQVFYALCRQRGVNPEEVLKYLGARPG